MGWCPRSRVPAIMAVIVAIATLTSYATTNADWSPSGTPVCRNPECLGFIPRIAADNAGGVLIAWHDYRSAVPTAYAKKLAPDGSTAPGWPSSGVRASSANPQITGLSIVSDGSGGMFVAWADFPAWDIYLQRLTSTGQVYPGWPSTGVVVCNAAGTQDLPTVVSDGGDGALVVWEDGRVSGEPEDIYCSHIMGDSQLAPGWPVNGQEVCADPAPQTRPLAVADNMGGAYVTWMDNRTTPWDLYVIRIQGDGSLAAGWQPNGTLVYAGSYYDFPHALVAQDTSGVFVLFGENPIFPQNQDLLITRLTADGSVSPGWPTQGVPVSVGPGHQQHARMDSDNAGGVVVVWDDTRTFGQPDVFASRVLSTGSRAPGWPDNGRLVAGGLSTAEFHTTIAGDGAGGAYIVFDRTTGSDGSSWIQHLTGNGGLAPGWVEGGMLVAPTNTDGQINPQVARDGAGGCFVVWSDLNQEEIYARRFGVDGPTPVLLSLVGVEASPTRVSVTWQLGGVEASRVTAYRRAVHSQEWLVIPHIDSGQSSVRVEDDRVEQGTRYAYRLGVSGEVFSDEVWVDVPRAPLAPALEGLSPNPASDKLRVAFTLSEPSTAVLDLLDVGGRSIVSRPLGQLAIGRHLIDLGGAQSLAPGVYWVRLTVGNRELFARGVVIR